VVSTHTATWSEHASSTAVLSQPVRLHPLIRSQSRSAVSCAGCKKRKIFVVLEYMYGEVHGLFILAYVKVCL
jgi:hypothetical protein